VTFTQAVTVLSPRHSTPLDYGVVDTQIGRGINSGIRGERPSRVTVYAEVDDLQAYLDKAARLDGTVMMPVTEIPGVVTMTLFSDPDSNITGLLKSAAPRA